MSHFANVAFKSGSASARVISALSLVMTVFGRPPGPTNPHQKCTSMAGTPCSPSVGKSGSAGNRLELVTASARILPVYLANC